MIAERVAPPAVGAPLGATVALLLVEDNAADARLVRELLLEARPHRFAVTHVTDLSGARNSLRDDRFDVIILDLGLPDSEGLDTLVRTRTDAPGVPVIVLTGVTDEQRAIAAVVNGAQDYLVKGSVTGHVLRQAVTYAIERARLERQFRQAQKMEAVGRLAGGVAHDFNNLLTVITSYTSLLLSEPELTDAFRDDLAQIGKAADSAATLTRQLLAFSRQQVVEPKVVNLNEVVRDAGKMLRRVIGEDVSLVMKLAPDLGCVLADSGQVEQVIMNMTVNARDAMPEGGRVVLETSNLQLDTAIAVDHFTAHPGSYVVLSIRDTGTGMTDETKARMFEPFYTTKESGKGTGLGLSMVFGIVQQSGGYITVDSVWGEGTAFNIHLPRVEAAMAGEATDPASVSPRGTETILLVEDVEALREIVRRVLVEHGYAVLDAVDASAALLRAEKYRKPIHLLLTDVVLPGLSGRELASRLKVTRPEMKVLFTSGYTDDAVMRRGVAERDIAFMQKPFTPETLARRVRQALDRGGAPGAGLAHDQLQ
jgi:two-component system cell cycle sensor histidine kinase/response regulator CckA